MWANANGPVMKPRTRSIPDRHRSPAIIAAPTAAPAMVLAIRPRTQMTTVLPIKASNNRLPVLIDAADYSLAGSAPLDAEAFDRDGRLGSAPHRSSDVLPTNCLRLSRQRW